MHSNTRKQTLIGISLALLACILWSFNFIVARGISTKVPPISIAFYRWACAALIIIPIAWKRFNIDKEQILIHWKNVGWATLTGIALYSPLIYLAAHYSPAINLALIGTTATPVFTIIIARIILKEKIPLLQATGLLLCIAGILLLISKGSWHIIANFHFSKGDKWMLVAALLFGTYNIVVRKKSPSIHPLSYLFVTFLLGALLLFPFFLWETNHSPSVEWNSNLVLIMLYTGAGSSVAAFFCWNAAITRLGPSRTAIFGNMIPVFASFEAVLILGETISLIQIVSMIVVAAGLVLANVKAGRLGRR